MKNKDVDIIMSLLENNTNNVSISQLSKKLKIDYKNTYTAVKRLEKSKIIILEKIGKAYNCILNNNMNPMIFEAEYNRREKLLKNKNFKILYNKLNSIKFPFIALIFGSYAKGTSNPHSDIDLMVICDKNTKDIERTISLLPLDIHLVTISIEEFLKMDKKKEFNVVAEAMKNNIILIGIEDYYRLINDVKPW